jgi:hypothetical protein
VRLWKNEEGGDFWTTGEGGGDRKRRMMTYAREVVNVAACLIRDPMTIVQLQNIIEKALGEIEGRTGTRDDRAMSACLGLWCLKRFRVRTTTIDPAEMRRKAVLAFAQQHVQFFGLEK